MEDRILTFGLQEQEQEGERGGRRRGPNCGRNTTSPRCRSGDACRPLWRRPSPPTSARHRRSSTAARRVETNVTATHRATVSMTLPGSNHQHANSRVCSLAAEISPQSVRRMSAGYPSELRAHNSWTVYISVFKAPSRT